MFKLQMEIGLGTNAYSKLVYTFPSLDLPSLKVLRRHMQLQTDLVAIPYDCCKNSCICYCGPFKNREDCLFCNHPRYRPDGRPYNQFHFLPITPQIKALYAGTRSATAMLHRSEHEFDHVDDPREIIDDLYGSALYRRLRESFIVVDGRQLPFKYFGDPRDVLLIGMTDGFQLFQRSNATAWPIIFVNANLSPEERYKLANILCAGLIPGPKKPKHFDSYFFLVVEELSTLALGVFAYDAIQDELFLMRVFSPYKSGDMPAAAQAYLKSKSPGAKRACRCCYIEGIRITGSKNNVHYLPILRPRGYPPSGLDPHNLPLRTHEQWTKMARRVDRSRTNVERKRRSIKYGINGTSIFSKSPGIHFPHSFPFDFMHLLKNTMENYSIFFGSPTYKDLDSGRESYIIHPAIWKQIGKSTALANATIPAQFGRSIPNIAEERFFFTAEAYMVWFTLYAPILLRGRFQEDKYYKHLEDFLSIVRRLLQFATTKAERDKLRLDIVKWYEAYEK